MWWETITLVAGLAGLAIGLALGVPVWVSLRSARYLGNTRMGSDFPGPDAPWVSVIVPACNEAAMIRPCLDSLMAQDYPSLEIIAVNDRSTDDTGPIMNAVAAEHARVRVLHVADLPDGWIGKNHANQVGAAAARGEWLLFTDGDIVFEPDAIRLGLAHVLNEDLDHLALFPGMTRGGFWEAAAICFFGCLFVAKCKSWLIRDPNRPDSFCGVGAFNLVRAAAYRAIGGHGRLALEVCDDMKLGKLLKRAGFVSDIMSGAPKIRVRWHVGLRGVITGLEKNGFAGSDYSLPRVLYGVTILTFLGVVPVLGLALAPAWIKPVYAAWLASGVGMLAAAAPPDRSRLAIGLSYPLMCLALGYAVARSTFLTIARGGIYWRGTFYPLARLRAGVV